MRPASSPEDFLADPYGRYFAGRRTAMFAHSPELLGLMSWGSPDVDDVRELLRLAEIGVAPKAPPHKFIVDLRALELVDPRTFMQFVEYTRKHYATLKQKIVKQVQIRPPGVIGAIIAGFGQVARLSYPERVFGDVGEAIDWLGLDKAMGADLIAELESIRAAANATDPLVRRVREILASSRCRDLGELAGKLGMSSRSCQRGLAAAGTTFRTELNAWRMQRARDLLLSGDRSMKWIAGELGFVSVQHFATAFRRANGETPTSWRDRNAPKVFADTPRP